MYHRFETFQKRIKQVSEHHRILLNDNKMFNCEPKRQTYVKMILLKYTLSASVAIAFMALYKHEYTVYIIYLNMKKNIHM